MKKIIYKIIYPLLIITGALYLSSCMRDDKPAGCPTDIKIYFTYTDNNKNPYAPGIDPDNIEKITLLLYDENNKLYGQWVDESPELSIDYSMTLKQVDMGTYRMIAWCGDFENDYSLTLGTSTMDETFVSLNRPDEGVTNIQSHLFYAGPEKNAEVALGGESFVLPMVQNTYTINMNICPDLGGTDVLVRDDNGTYGAENSFISDSLHYKRPIEDGFCRVRVMRLAENRTPKMEIVDTPEETTIVDFNLVTLLLLLRNEGATVDLDNIHEYDLELCKDGARIIVSMDQWQVEISGHVLSPR